VAEVGAAIFAEMQVAIEPSIGRDVG